MNQRRIVGQDLSALPPYGFGSKSMWFWATVGFMMIEGMGFALALGSYVYLMNLAPPDRWPLKSPDPKLWAGTLQAVLLLISLAPAFILMKRAQAMDLKRTRFWAVIVSLFNVAALVVRGFEFTALNVRWEQDAYGSITWALLALHTTHLLTDAPGTVIMTIWLFTHKVEPERFADVESDCAYWAFVVLTWMPIYFTVYLAPRLH